MLETLFGSKSLERVLLFLLVHESGYLQEISRAYRVALNPLQNAVEKLENLGVIQGEKAGKKKHYQLNISHPLFSELQALLKKVFVFLPTEEKRALFSQTAHWSGEAAEDYAKQKRARLCLEAFWQRLSQVEKISIRTKTHGGAFGKVEVIQEKPDVILFTENGSWVGGSELHFYNKLRWSIDFTNGLVSLEHLRYGIDAPVFLFHLAPVGPKTLQSIDSHLGGEECYFGRIAFTKQHICFSWRILGATLIESLHYVYS